MLCCAISADQAVIAVLSAVRLISWLRAGRVVVPPAIGTVVAVWVIRAVGAVVGVGAGTITGVGMIRAVLVVRPGILRTCRTACMIHIWVPAAVRTVVAVRAKLAVRSVVGVGAGMVVSVGVIRAIGGVVGVIFCSGRTASMVSGSVRMPPPTGAEISIRVVGAVGAVMRIGAGMVVSVGVIRAVRSVVR